MSEEIGEACSPSALDAPVELISGSSEAEKREFFTVVFRGDVAAYPANPFLAETPFGKPEAVGRGDAFAEIDRLEQEAERLKLLVPSYLKDAIRKLTPEEQEFCDRLSYGAWYALRDTDLTTAKAVDEFVQKYSANALRGLPGVGKQRVIEIVEAANAVLRPAQ